MGAGLQPLVSELRAGPEYRRYGDPFEWSAVVVHEGLSGSGTAARSGMKLDSKRKG